MALPTTGSISASMISIELGRGATAPFSLNDAAARGLAAKVSGSISFQDFLGKASELVRTLTAGAGEVTLESLFTAAEWTSATKKRVILASGSERGNSSNTNAAVSIGPTGWGGELTFVVNGTISGKGGAPNAGTGGDAFDANRLGASGQKIILRYAGILRGGAGGGGKAGKGGDGTAQETTTTTETPTYNATTDRWTYASGSGRNNIKLGNVQVYDAVSGDVTQLKAGDWTYNRGALMATVSTTRAYAFSRSKSVSQTIPTVGGQGGEGGAGEGFNQARTNGSAGSPGGTNAGAGGTGGSGGLYGAVGNTGAPGANGNAASGANGIAGGHPGYAIKNAANADLTGSTGTLLGRT